MFLLDIVLFPLDGVNVLCKKSDCLNPLSANPTKWSKTLTKFVGKLPENCLSVFDHFVELAFKELKNDH